MGGTPERATGVSGVSIVHSSGGSCARILTDAVLLSQMDIITEVENFKI